ncbi:MAG: tetratricopeptide repeat protein [Alphaproteobacteria bacterium]|nr:tetratricopeptide repeat protein [Alphaproteobacteria bacterium]
MAEALQGTVTLLADVERRHRAGLAAMRAGDPAAAAGHFRVAAAAAPEVAAYHANLGSALQAAGRHEAALAAFDRAIVLAPDHPAIHHNRGNALLALRRPLEAAAAQERAAALAPRTARFHYARALALDRADLLDEAAACYRAALAVDPDHGPARAGLALLRLAAGDRAAALTLWREQAARERGIDAGRPYPAGHRLANRGKLRHDVEQLRWLIASGERPDLGPTLAAYEAALAAMPDGADLRRPVALPDAVLAALGGSYGRTLHLLDAPGMPASPLAERDWNAVETAYAADAPGIVAVDDLLTPPALAALRRFCLGSTIFHHAKHGGYVGAYLPEVACGLLAQIADALPRRMPSVFGRHRLRQMWIYKYDSRMEGIGTHADAAAVNVNFWLTPDEANLSPGSGGLVVHRCEAPLDWSFRRFNEDEAAIADHLARHGAGTVTVPYRCNRAVIFHSDLFHATDRFVFRDRYEDRRLNVTMLYGDRADGAA